MNLLAQLIKSTNGRFFRVVFRKRTGDQELRCMTCRTGVAKHLRGGSLVFNPKEHDLQIVWEPGKGYRSIPLDAVTMFQCGNLQWRAT